MMKAIGVTVLILAASFIIYLLLFSYGKTYTDHSLLLYTERPHHVYSIREIDSISAEMNYRFTAKNAIVPVNKDSLKIPNIIEIPSI